MKVLNLYAGLGGNRKLWTNCDVTAVEFDEETAKVYAQLYPKDIMIVGDAHEFLLKHYKEYDFIWSSPPCQSHSSMRHNLAVKLRGTPAVYPDFKLYEEIVFLKHHAECAWVVENVKPYYTPLIPPDFVLQRHYFWASNIISEREFPHERLRKVQIGDLEKLHGISLKDIKLSDKRQRLRNCVYPPLGDYVFRELNKEKN